MKAGNISETVYRYIEYRQEGESISIHNRRYLQPGKQLRIYRQENRAESEEPQRRRLDKAESLESRIRRDKECKLRIHIGRRSKRRRIHKDQQNGGTDDKIVKITRITNAETIIIS